jgi:hypothetical protein
MLFWMAQISDLAPNQSLHLFFCYISSPFGLFFATVLHTHMIEGFEILIKKRRKSFGLTKIVFQQLITVVYAPVGTCSFRLEVNVLFSLYQAPRNASFGSISLSSLLTAFL